MLRSMTGYGRASNTDGKRSVTIEMKSVNNRFLDIDFSMPKPLTYLEEQFKKMLRDAVKRGKVNVTVIIDGAPLTDTRVEINWPLLEQYQSHMDTIAKKYNRKNDWQISDILQWPGIFTQVEKSENASTYEPLITQTMKEALDQLVELRTIEGQNLRQDLCDRIETVSQLVEKIKQFVPEIIQQYEERLMKKVTDFLDGRVPIDEARIINEVAVYADKSDITEELLRLNSHTRQFLDIIEESEPKGRKLDFLLQEMNREINTIGSKVSSAEVSRYVVNVKSELEKMREQVQNIE